MYRMLLALTLLLTVAPVGGQQVPVVSGRAKVVFVDYFTCAPGIGYEGVEYLRNGIMECMRRSGRVELKDASCVPVLRVEKEEQTSGAFMKDKVVREQVVRYMGGQYVVTGHIRSLAVTERRDAGGEVCYDGSLAFVLKVKDVSDASVRFAGSYAYSGLTGGTPGEVMGQGIARMAPEIDAFVRRNFKVEGSIVQVEGGPEGAADEVYVDLGFAQGVSRGQQLDVYAGYWAGDKRGREVIGVLQVTEVLGDEIAVCRIRCGRKRILHTFRVMQAVIPGRRFLFGGVVVR